MINETPELRQQSPTGDLSPFQIIGDIRNSADEGGVAEKTIVEVLSAILYADLA